MKPNLLPQKARHVVLWGQASLMDVALLLVMYDGASQDSRGPARLC
jgi:hypothetical protein